MWRKIKNTNYEVSSRGEVRNADTGLILKDRADKDGYRLVNFKGSTYRVHRLVANAFIENPENKPCVNHKNSNRADNSIDNLEWVTHKENTQHGITLGFIDNKRFVSRAVAYAKSKENRAAKQVLAKQLFGAITSDSNRQKEVSLSGWKKRKEKGYVSPLKDKVFSQEEKEKYYPKSTCPACGLTGNSRAMKMWHGVLGEKCKKAGNFSY